MTRYSITRRLMVTILAAQLGLTCIATCIELLSLRSQHLKTFDVMLRGRADTVFGAVQDAEDPADNVYLDTSALDVPRRDIYEVTEESGRLVGRSANWSGAPALLDADRDIHDLKIGGKPYRGLVMHVVRNIDPDDKGPGIPHRLIVFYAAPLSPVWHSLAEEARLLALGNFVLLLFTAIFLFVLLRRGLSPLQQLAEEASRISPHALTFRAPPSAYAARELAPLAQALDTAIAGLKRSFEQQRTFVSDAAHELKTAVSIVKSSLQLLALRQRDAVEYRRGLELALRDCERMEELVLKMLMLARAEEELQQQIDPNASADLLECLRTAAEQLKPAAESKHIAISLPKSASASVRMSSDDVVVVAGNLILNAVQHSSPGSRVDIEIKPSGFSVRDFGPGIAPEALPFVFDRFYREDKSRARNTGGTGLGLAICKAIVEGRGGDITIESAPGKGTVVNVSLPLAERWLEPHEEPSASLHSS